MSEPFAMRQRIQALASLGAVFAWIDAHVGPVPPRPIERAAALGRVVAADVTVAALMPATAIALREGWAVQSDLLTDAGSYGQVQLARAPEWVEVGDAIMNEADAVVAPDAVVTRGGMAEALVAAVPGEGVLARGAGA